MVKAMSEDNETSSSSSERGYKSVLPKAPFDELFLKETFMTVICIKAATDPDWKTRFATALQNNLIETSAIQPERRLTSANLPLAKWRNREQMEGVGESSDVLYLDQLMDIIQLARDCGAEQRYEENRQLLEFVCECLNEMNACGYSLHNAITMKSLALLLLSQVSESMNEIPKAALYQLALIELSNECEDTAIGQMTRRALESHKRQRIERLVGLYERQNKHEEASRWREVMEGIA